MLTRRGYAVLGTAALLYAAARALGSGELHIIALGLILLPPLSLLLVRWGRHHLRAVRRLDRRRVPAGGELHVSLEIQNLGRSPTGLVLVEDRLPVALGRAARAVLDGIPGRTRQTISYPLPCGRRGRYHVGPLLLALSDPFGLAHLRVRFDETHELIVHPHVEDLRAVPIARALGGSGPTTARLLHRTGEEFYTMRQYEIGDDLRRIHWPSTARTGKLMIRQDEAGRRASATVFLDTRATGYGASRAVFENAVSAAASAGSLYAREGLQLRLATTDLEPRTVGSDAFLDLLAQVEASGRRSLAPALMALRDRAATGSSLVAVVPALRPEEAQELLGAAREYGHRLAIVVAAEDEDERARAALRTLARAGWEAVLLPPGRRLREAWTFRTARPVPTAAGS